MSSGNKLKGRFLECCDCYTICPCWVKERPDEDHCSALYVWTFDDDAAIEGKPIGGKSVAAAAFYGGRGKMQSAIYVDDTLDASAQRALMDAFTGKTIESMKGLARLVGAVVDRGQARIAVKDAKHNGGKWEVTVEVEGSRLARATGTAAYMEGRSRSLTLNETALHDELGVEGAVEVQSVDRFEMAVSPLPGGPFIYSGRAGMAARFDYGSRRLAFGGGSDVS